MSQQEIHENLDRLVLDTATDYHYLLLEADTRIASPPVQPAEQAGQAVGLEGQEHDQHQERYECHVTLTHLHRVGDEYHRLRSWTVGDFSLYPKPDDIPPQLTCSVDDVRAVYTTLARRILTLERSGSPVILLGADVINNHLEVQETGLPPIPIPYQTPWEGSVDDMLRKSDRDGEAFPLVVDHSPDRQGETGTG